MKCESYNYKIIERCLQSVYNIEVGKDFVYQTSKAYCLSQKWNEFVYIRIKLELCV